MMGGSKTPTLFKASHIEEGALNRDDDARKSNASPNRDFNPMTSSITGHPIAAKNQIE